MDLRPWFLVALATLITHTTGQDAGKEAAGGSKDKGQGTEWDDVVECFKILTNQTALPVTDALSPAQMTRNMFKGICGTKEQFLACVDKSLNQADSNSVVQLFRPLFNVSMVNEAYDDLCADITVTDSDEDLSCLMNSTALLPCYNEYYNYVFYLSVVRRFGSPERQLTQDVLDTLLCTLAEERRDCEVAALSICSTKIGVVMKSFYQKTLPSVCNEEEKENDATSEQNKAL